MKGKSIIKVVLGIGLFIIALIVSNLVIFSVDTTEYVVITQFGNPVRTIFKAGLKYKLPEPIQTIHRFDRRLQVYEVGELELLTKDKKSVIVDHYGTWRIKDPITYMKTVKDKIGAEARLSDTFSSSLGVALGRYNLDELINIDANRLKFDRMLQEVMKRCRDKAGDYGIEVINVKLRTLNFPEKNKLSVFRRMKAEREQMARKYRSEGSEEAAKIRAKAQKEQRTLISAAYKQAEQIKGEGDAEAIRLYAEAYQKNPQFYEFIRTLEAYEKLIDEKTTIVLPADSELLKYLETINPQKAQQMN
ncbi:MAG TPA: protease modulator HflC [Candidatus Omnitrophica bacterium]|nr:protease modulator HflC [Candidatus Omnitrophota bacterium]